MWVPKSAAELESAARSGNLEETHTFEAKRELPQAKKNVDVAIDVCAMTVDGGVVVWGVGEDEHGRPTVPAPFELKGQPERVDLIVRTSIAEVPFITLVALPLDDDTARGYLVAVVPPSGRAPHQVLSGGELRYYGRGDKTNRILNEGEVAQLYARRAAVEISAERLLSDTLNMAPFGPEQGLAYLHAFVRPVPPDDGMYDRAEAQAVGGDPLRLRLQQAIRRPTVGAESVPQLRTQQGWSRRGADAWSLENQAGEPQARRAVRFDLNMDGRGYLFCGRAGETPRERPDYRGPDDPARPASRHLRRRDPRQPRLIPQRDGRVLRGRRLPRARGRRRGDHERGRRDAPPVRERPVRRADVQRAELHPHGPRGGRRARGERRDGRRQPTHASLLRRAAPIAARGPGEWPPPRRTPRRGEVYAVVAIAVTDPVCPSRSCTASTVCRRACSSTSRELLALFDQLEPAASHVAVVVIGRAAQRLR